MWVLEFDTIQFRVSYMIVDADKRGLELISCIKLISYAEHYASEGTLLEGLDAISHAFAWRIPRGFPSQITNLNDSRSSSYTSFKIKDKALNR